MSLKKVLLCVACLGLTLSAQTRSSKKASLQKPAASVKEAETTKPVSNDPLVVALERELTRAQRELAKADPAPYHIAYSVTDDDVTAIVATQGGLATSVGTRRRTADVLMRVGSHQLDNTHNDHRRSGITSGSLPLNDDADAIALELWRLTDRGYQQAAQEFLKAKTEASVRAKEEDDSDDFSKDKETITAKTDPLVVIDHPQWEQFVRRCSARFKQYPWVYQSLLVLTVNNTHKYFVSTDGARTHTATPLVRMMVGAQSTAEDGMELMRVETFEAPGLAGLPTESEMASKIDKMAQDLKALRAAPAAEAFSGPALLSGRSAAVFFHEVLGHRLEGQRQRGDGEGQTFTKQVGKPVLPQFLSVTDDPTRDVIDSIPLAGRYVVDDEGIPASKVALIENGILKTFLMSRMPVKDMAQSNGHGRRQAGLMPVARQGNLIVTSSKAVSEPELRQQFVAEIKRQGKPYGLYFEDIEGGFTMTARAMPQAFQVLPVMVWKVFADGRPDELVRGVDIVGTPLTALTRIISTGDKPFVFNGVCGAESGQVPVSAVAPAMLFSELEVQRKQKGHERPPILPSPEAEETQTEVAQ
jgi:predicted Zn-dependent protease